MIVVRYILLAAVFATGLLCTWMLRHSGQYAPITFVFLYAPLLLAILRRIPRS